MPHDASTLPAAPSPDRGETSPSTQGSHLARLLEHRREFLRFLTRRVSSVQAAEDILQSAYVRALEHDNDMAMAESSVAWFYRVLQNATIDYYRRRGVEGRALEDWARQAETEVQADDLSRDLTCRCIERVLPSLHPAYAEILQEVDLNEGPLKTFAERQRITIANATVRLHRARKALRQRLTETCGACAEHHCLHCTCH